MTTEIIARPEASIAQLDADSKYAAVLFRSGLFQDVKSEAQAVVKVMAGRELGLSPFVAMRDLSIIQGKIACAAAQIAAKIQMSGGDWQAIHYLDDRCVLRFSRGGKILTPDIEFNMQHATAMQFAGKDNYRKQPRVMLFWRAMTMGARMFFPAVFNGPVYTPDELRDGSADLPEPVTPTATAPESPERPALPKAEPAPQRKTRPAAPATAPSAAPEPRINPEAAQTLPAVTESDLPTPEGNPWLYRLEGTAATRADFRGKLLLEIPDASLRKALTASQANKSTELDKRMIATVLGLPEESRDDAADEVVAQKEAAAAQNFEIDQIPNYDEVQA